MNLEDKPRADVARSTATESYKVAYSPPDLVSARIFWFTMLFSGLSTAVGMLTAHAHDIIWGLWSAQFLSLLIITAVMMLKPSNKPSILASEGLLPGEHVLGRVLAFATTFALALAIHIGGFYWLSGRYPLPEGLRGLILTDADAPFSINSLLRLDLRLLPLSWMPLVESLLSFNVLRRRFPITLESQIRVTILLALINFLTFTFTFMSLVALKAFEAPDVLFCITFPLLILPAFAKIPNSLWQIISQEDHEDSIL